MYGVEINKDLVSRITNKILLETISWQTRPIDNLYQIIFVDRIRFKVQEEGQYNKRQFYIIIGIDLEGMKEVFWGFG